MADVTSDQVDQEINKTVELKEVYFQSRDDKNRQAYRKQAQKASDLRTEWRGQEVAAGRRSAGHSVVTDDGSEV